MKLTGFLMTILAIAVTLLGAGDAGLFLGIIGIGTMFCKPEKGKE